MMMGRWMNNLGADPVPVCIGPAASGANVYAWNNKAYIITGPGLLTSVIGKDGAIDAASIKALTQPEMPLNVIGFPSAQSGWDMSKCAAASTSPFPDWWPFSVPITVGGGVVLLGLLLLRK